MVPFHSYPPYASLIEPEKPSLSRYIDLLNFTGTDINEVAGFAQLLRGIRYY
jgi:hypothetical protein